MKDKIVVNTNVQYLQMGLVLKCYKPICKKRKNRWKQLFEKYQTRIDTTVAGAVIGLMFLTGIWMFLVQLAECVE